MRTGLLSLAPALRVARGFAIAAACSVAASASAATALVLVRVLGFVAEQQPKLFLAAAFGPCLWLFVRFAFNRRTWH